MKRPGPGRGSQLVSLLVKAWSERRRVKGANHARLGLGLLISLMFATLGCSSGGPGVGDGPLEGVVGNDPAGTTLPASEASPWDGPPPRAADVEAAYTDLVACLTNAGIEGWIRFDLARSTAMFTNYSLGITEAEISQSERSIKRCSDEFDAVMDPYMYANPETEAQRDAIRHQILLCVDNYFPEEKMANDLSFDDTMLKYGELEMDNPGIYTNECFEEAWAGPRRFFGAS